MANTINYAISISALGSKDKSEVGIPALELSELINANVPIPSGFIVTQEALEHFAFATQLDQKVKQLQHIGSFSEASLTKLILESEIPREIYDSISREYTALSGISNVWMRIRAGLYDSSGNPLTFIDEKEINEVKGFEALELELKKVWAKLLIIDQKYDSLGSFVIIQKLVPAEVSGVILTQDLKAQESDHIIIKSMYGEFNEKYINSCDSYTFSKQEEKILDRKIAPQDKMDIRSSKGDFGYEEVEIAEKWKLKQKLSDKYIEDLGYLGDYLENVFTKAQEVTWSFQAGKIWINYVRPLSEKFVSENHDLEEKVQKDLETITPIVEKDAEELMEDQSIDIEMPSIEPAQHSTDIPVNESERLPEIIEKSEIKELEAQDIKINLKKDVISRDVLVAGVGNNKGIIEGKVVFSRDNCTDNDILLLSQWDEMPKHAAAVIVEDMIGVNSEFPLIYGAELASRILRDGEFISLDTDTGFIFEGTSSTKEVEAPQLSEVIAEEDDDVMVFVDQDKIKEIDEDIPVTKIETTQEVAPEPSPIMQEVIPTAIPEVVAPVVVATKIEKKKTVKKPQKIEKESIENTNTLEDNIPTAIKVIAHVTSHMKEDIKYCDGFLINLPHAEDYLLSKDNIDYKSIKNLIYNFTLPFAKNPKHSLIYNISDINPATYIKNSDLLLVQCESIHKLRSKENLRQLHIALPKFKNLKQLREFRKSVSAAGLRRSTTFKVYIKVAYSSNIFELPTYLEDRFDGVIVNLESLHNSLYSSEKKLVRVTNTLLTTLNQIQKECKTAKVPMIIDLKGVKLSKSVMDKLDPYINYAVSVIPKYTEFTKKHIMDLEKKRIFK